MSKQKKKTRRDTAEIARSVVEQVIGENLVPKDGDEIAKDTIVDDDKNQSAVERGRQGGEARALKLSRDRRVEIAKKAAQSRWRKGRSDAQE